MSLLFLHEILNGKVAHALCWMLVHSLWMGLLLTIITGIIMLGTKKQTAALRYQLLTASLLLFTVAVAALFIVQFVNGYSQLNRQVTDTATAIIYSNSRNQSLTGTNKNFTGTAVNFLNDHANIIVLCWFVIIALRSISLVSGLYRIKQMKTTQITMVSNYWKEKLLRLSTALNIQVQIEFFASGIAKMPMVLGHFKPVVLFPAALLSSLPPQQVEAVLLHELAHIKRKDYLINMLQNFLEILFFFNPAVLWVSALIKTERENCCDDIVVAETSSKRNYINALLSFQEFQLNAPGYAPAFAGDKKHLLQRVKRMLYNNNKTLNNMEKTFLTTCLMASVLLTVFFTQPTTAQSNDSTAVAVNTGTVPSIANRKYDPANFEEGSVTKYYGKANGIDETLTIYKKNGVLYEIYGDMTSFKINGKAIPKNEWGKYKALINESRSKDQTMTVANNDGQLNELKAAQMALLAQQEKVIAEKQAQLSLDDKLKAEQMELMAKQEKFAEEQFRKNEDKFKAEQQELQAMQDKFAAEQNELIAEKNKLQAEQQQLFENKSLLKNKEFLKQEAELNNKARALKLEAEKLEKNNLNEKLAAEKAAGSMQKQKLAAEKAAQDAEIQKMKAEQIQIEKEKQRKETTKEN